MDLKDPEEGTQCTRTPQKGDVYQINEKHDRAGWIGAFVLATEIKAWGIQGFVHAIKTHDEQASIWIRLEWDHIDYVGRAALIQKKEEGFLEEWLCI